MFIRPVAHASSDLAHRSPSLPDRYSCRKVVAGSTIAARRAGTHVAAAATASNSTAIAIPISNGLIPGAIRIPCNSAMCSPATLSGRPRPRASTLIRTPDARNIRATPVGCAPTAMRMPISRVRCCTASDTTP